MRSFSYFLPFVAVAPSLAFLIPGREVTQRVVRQSSSEVDKMKDVLDSLEVQFEKKLDLLLEFVQGKDDAVTRPRIEDVEFFDGQAWLEHAQDFGFDENNSEDGHDHDRHHHDGHHHDGHHHHNHGGAPDDNDPLDGTDPGDGPPYHRSPKEPPHHTPGTGHSVIPHVHRPKMPPKDRTGPHKDKSIADLISSSKHTSRFWEYVEKDQKIKDMLSDKGDNLTLFAPTNHAFEMLDRYCKDHGEVSKDKLHRILLYHLADGTHPSQDLRYHNTFMTKLPEEELGDGMHQRVRIGLSHRGPTINFYSEFKMFDIFAANGVIHAIDSLLFPPPELADIIQILPTEFSTTESALHRTGLIKELPKLKGHGLTVFTPSNRDWQKLGFAANAFLFSKMGHRYLKAILKYHIVPGHTLYSDAHVCPNEKHSLDERDDPSGLFHGYSHTDLPTMLHDKHISVDITRLERFLSFRTNGLTSIVISDGIAKNGVVQVPDHVLIPPHCLDEHHNPPDLSEEDQETLDAGEMPVAILKDILEPYIMEEKKAEQEEKMDIILGELDL